MNELILIASVVILYSLVLFWYKLFGKDGLYCFTVFATITANIEVLMLVKAFGIEMTLGNILFATTFIVTDILSENEGKEAANKAANIGIATGLSFAIVSISWLLYSPSENDWAYPSIKALFSATPRIIISSLIVYIIAQKLDIWLYHKIWEKTEKKYGDKKGYLWIRNNVATMTSQLVNAILYNLFAFYGIYSADTLMKIIISTFCISIVTSVLDTPLVYIARRPCGHEELPLCGSNEDWPSARMKTR